MSEVSNGGATARARHPLHAHSTKFSLPVSHVAFVHRSALAERVSQSPDARLLLIRAPAGFGKTSVLRQLHEQMSSAGVATAWITLDNADNDMPRLLGCLNEAVRRLRDSQPDRSSDDPPDAITFLSREGAPFALFLDEFEHLQSPAVLGLFREILGRLPHGGRLVIGTRTLPDIGLGKLRVRHQLVELGVEHLRFSVPEARELMRLRGPFSLTADALEHLQSHTEGWVAALILASLAMDGQRAPDDFIRRLSGARGAIAEYLAEEVIASQPADIREFLMRVSLLRQLSAPLCQTLLPGVDAERMLRRLHDAGLFVTEVDTTDDEPTYRLHSLFAQYLRRELAREHPADVRRLHALAAHWYRANGRPVPAIEHAIEADDIELARTLLDQHAQTFLEQGRMRLLARWFDALPRDVSRDSARMQAISVWATLFRHGPIEASQRLADAGIENWDEPLVQAHVNALQPVLLAMMDRHEDAYELGHASLARLPSRLPFADAVLINCMAYVSSVMGDKREAQRLLDAARRVHTASAFNRMYAESTEGLLDSERGRFRQATARFRLAIDAGSRDHDYGHSSGHAWAGVLYATAMYEADDLDEAERLLRIYLPLAREMGLPDQMITSYTLRSRLFYWRGEDDSATSALDELEALGHRRHLPRVVASAKLERARLLLLQGKASCAREELDRANDVDVWRRIERQRLPAHDVMDLTIGQLRWQIHFGDARQVIEQIDAALPAVLAEGRVRRSRKLRVLKAMAACRLGLAELAAETISPVVREGSREGFTRPILDEGPLVAGPLQASLPAPTPNAAEPDPILADYLQRMLRRLAEHARPDQPAPLVSCAARAPQPVQTLSKKELRVLELLAQGYPNHELAARLYVSDSTVRTHLRNINAKLGAQNRTHAVSLARQLGLIR